MSRLHQRSELATYILGAALLQICACDPAMAQSTPRTEEAEWTWPKTLQLSPAHPGDPVKLVKITKGGEELLPGKYEMPQVDGDDWQQDDAVKKLMDWLSDISFTLKSQTSKDIVAVSIAVVLPYRERDLDCNAITGSKSAHELWCDLYPHWCDGGCPGLYSNLLHWGFIPDRAAAGLRSRYNAEARPDRAVVQGKEPLRLVPGGQVTLTSIGRVLGIGALTDPRHGVYDSVTGFLWGEGIEEAKDEQPCEWRANSKTGCAFAEVSKFNFGIDVVYFDDGTIWGNFGYGYALPNADGIFTRVNARDALRDDTQEAAPN